MHIWYSQDDFDTFGNTKIYQDKNGNERWEGLCKTISNSSSLSAYQQNSHISIVFHIRMPVK